MFDVTFKTWENFYYLKYLGCHILYDGEYFRIIGNEMLGLGSPDDF